MNKHKPGCKINMRCLVYHENGVCPGPYGKCDCGVDGVPSHQNGGEVKHRMYCSKSGMRCLVYHSDGKCPDVENCEGCKAETSPALKNEGTKCPHGKDYGDLAGCDKCFFFAPTLAPAESWEGKNYYNIRAVKYGTTNLQTIDAIEKEIAQARQEAYAEIEKFVEEKKNEKTKVNFDDMKIYPNIDVTNFAGIFDDAKELILSDILSFIKSKKEQ